MQLIFNREVAEQLREQYVVLELETVTKDGVTLDAFCVIPTDKIVLTDLPNISHYIHLHNEFTAAYRRGEYKVCRDLYEHLLGKFGGEVDTFYEEIIRRILNLEQESTTS